MGLDIRTIMVIIAMMAFMFALLLELAGLHAGKIRGVRQWAVANLCFGLGLGLAYFHTAPSPGSNLAIVTGATLIAASIGFQFTGIQAFREERPNWLFGVLIVGMAFLQNLWFGLLHPHIELRAIANSLLFAVGYGACARALLVKAEPPLRTAYWFTGLSFAVLVLVMLVRGVTIWLSPPGTYGLYVNIPLNPFAFFTACVVQLCVTFGFVLMLNYRLFADIQKLASRDVLTGAFNRRQLEEEAVRQRAKGLRTDAPLSVMLIDVDHFKSINDDYGHPAGDEVLRRLVATAQAAIRPDDYLARYGGEEFCILLPATTEREAFTVAERLRAGYAAMHIDFGGKSMKSTISIGVADSTRLGLEFSALVAAADRALYSAKQAGRNQVVSYSSIAD